ncbi:MAG: hypothetical protein AB1486_33720 [Planctomycetota bacterium]
MQALVGKRSTDTHARVRMAHAAGVARLVEEALAESQECADPVGLAELTAAALGHHLYEDTAVDRSEVKRLGTRIDLVIDGLTVRDRAQPAPVLDRRLVDAARLIKLADLVDNTLAAAADLARLGSDWARKRFLPTLTHVSRTVHAATVTEYPSAAQRLRERLHAAMDRLNANIAVQREREQATPARPLATPGPLVGDADVLAAHEESQLREGWLVQGMHVFGGAA